MGQLKFLAGVLLVQAVTAGLVVMLGAPIGTIQDAWPIVVVLVVIGLVAAFWFNAMAVNMRSSEIERLRSEFASEREALRVKAERDKTREVRRSHKVIASETRRVTAKANFKVGAAMTGAVAVGALMMLTNFFTLGLVLLTGAGGALGGYLLRRDGQPLLRLPGRQTNKMPQKQ